MQDVNNHEKELSADPLYKLSTNSKAAREGFAEFTFLLQQCSQSARQLFIGSAPVKPHSTKFIDVRRCATGISAEIAFETDILEAFPTAAFEEAEQVINNQAQHFFFYRRERIPQYYHLFNLVAVRQVARNYPEYFPADVITHTRSWLQDHWTFWADGSGMNCIRYGLLSGFPLEAAQAFSRYKQAKEKLIAKEAALLSDEEKHFVGRYAFTQRVTGQKISDSREERASMDQLLHTARKKQNRNHEATQLFTEEECALLSNTHHVLSEGMHLAYYGIAAEKDHRYLQQLEALYQQTVIKSQ